MRLLPTLDLDGALKVLRSLRDEGVSALTFASDGQITSVTFSDGAVSATQHEVPNDQPATGPHAPRRSTGRLVPRDSNG